VGTGAICTASPARPAPSQSTGPTKKSGRWNWFPGPTSSNVLYFSALSDSALVSLLQIPDTNGSVIRHGFARGDDIGV
jgi:hypothetical protein